VLRQVGPFGSVQVAMHLLRHLWRDFLLAGLLCALSVPLNPALALKLAPEVLLPIWGIAVSVFVGFRGLRTLVGSPAEPRPQMAWWLWW
jgi:hypothetical protein